MGLYLEGVHCASCVWVTEKLPEYVSGVESLRLNLSDSIATIRVKPGSGFSEAARELAKLGYRPHPVKEDESTGLQKQESRKHLVQLGVAGAAAGNIMLLAVALYAGADGSFAETFRWVSLLLYIPVLGYSAVPFYRSAWASLRRRQISVDVPIVFGLAVGTIASIVNLLRHSPHIYFDSLSSLVFLLLSTRYLLRKVHQRAVSASQLMYFLAPSMARRLNPSTGAFGEVPTNSLQEGDLIQVLPSECFPVDGILVRGESAVSCALLTGESEPKTIRAGASVHAGTWNHHAPVEVRVMASGAETRLGKILQAMEEGLARKAPIVSYLDRVGQAFVAAVLVLTAFGFVLGLTISWHEAINRALAVAIVVCPCTFALATPLAMSLAISRCAKNGILVKGADIIERLSLIESVFFDKTGTLTTGELEVLSWEAKDPEAELVLRALESKSAHPISQVVRRHFQSEVQLPEITEFKETAGWGVSGRIHGIEYEVKRLDEIGVGVFRDGRQIGELIVGDSLRDDSRSNVRKLRDLGLKIYIVSGDSSRPVRAAARALKIPSLNAIAKATPEEKGRKLESASRSLMVGDGANDAIALASAFAGVAVRGGMEVSLRAAGVYSSKPGIGPVYPLLVVARETMRVIRRNLTFAIFYNVVGIGVALSGHLDPLFAAVLMPVSALTVFASTMIGTRRMRRAFRQEEA